MEGTSMMGVQPTMPVYAGDSFGGNSIWFLLIFAFLIMGGGFGGYGANRQTATTDELSAGFNFAGVNNSLKDLTLGQANINQNLGNAICSSTYELAGKIDTASLQTQLGMKDVVATVIAENNATRELIRQDKIEALQAQVNQLQLAQATCGIPKVNPYAYGTYQYPCFSGCGYTTM